MTDKFTNTRHSPEGLIQSDPRINARSTGSGIDAEGGSAQEPTVEALTEGTSGGSHVKTRSPAEAFADLTNSVYEVQTDLGDLRSFVETCKDKLFHQSDEYKVEGMRTVLESLFRIHDLIFRQVTAMESGNNPPEPFTLNLFETLESELSGQGVEVVRPHPGDDVNMEFMVTIGSATCPFWRTPDKIAQVSSCGFVLITDSSRHVLRKAEITVYRR